MTAAEPVNLTPVRQSRAELEKALRDAGAEIRRNVVRCPFHDDQTPSASIHQRPDGVWAFKCHGCGINEDVIGIRARASGKDSATVVRSMRDESAKPPRVFATVAELLESVGHYAKVEAHYAYTNPATGHAEMVVIRCRDESGRKTFLQASDRGAGLVQRAPVGAWPLYNRRRVAGTPEVVLVEGEKCVHALHECGVVATTSPGGADNARRADWSPLAGKRVYLWPDNDAKGVQYMRDAAECLQKLSPSPELRWVESAEFNLPEKSDVVEYLAAYGGDTPDLRREAVRSALDESLPFGPSAKVRKILEDTISGQRVSIPWPWPALTANTNALLPGAVCLVVGDPESSKSFLMLQAARYWWEHKIKFALYQLEEDEDGAHLLRALVQQAGCTDLLNPIFVKNNPDAVREMFDRHRVFLDSFGPSLFTPPAEPPPLNDLADWVRDRAKEGCRVIAIDPISAAEGNDKPWINDKKFILSTKIIARDYNASLVLVTHPRRGSKGGMDDVGGGMGLVQFSQTVLWVKKFYPARHVRCKTKVGDFATTINRSVRIGKARLGPGGGMELGYIIGEGLQFAEQGTVVKDVRQDTEAA